MDQVIVVDERIRITILAIERSFVRLGIDAPKEVGVHRLEIFEAMKKKNESFLHGGAAGK